LEAHSGLRETKVKSGSSDAASLRYSIKDLQLMKVNSLFSYLFMMNFNTGTSSPFIASFDLRSITARSPIRPWAKQF
jgi:hypothetical protein